MDSGKQSEKDEKPPSVHLDGTHLMADCFGCRKEILSDPEKIKEYLDSLPEILGMKKLIKPYVVVYEGGSTWDRGGITGFMLIAESHISVHTFPYDGFVTLDVYSCKPFDVEKAVEFIKGFFESGKEEIKVVKREIEVVREKNLAKQVCASAESSV